MDSLSRNTALAVTKRLLITGSRDWDDIDAIETQLRLAVEHLGTDEDIVLVSGACPTGADRMCEDIWSQSGYTLELHPANWNEHGKRAGFVRNAEMVFLGADLCIAFIKNESRGATMTADMAEKGEIETWRVIDKTRITRTP